MTVEPEGTFVAEEWVMNDSILACIGKDTGKVFTIFSVPGLEKRLEFGSIGNGPDNYVSPHLAAICGDTAVIIDNGRRQLLKIVGDSIAASKALSFQAIVNQPKLKDNENLIYLTSEAEGPSIVTHNLIDETEILKLPLSAIDTDISNISYDTDGNHIVATSSANDKVLIYDIDSGKSVTLTGNGNADFYYSDIICDDESFYLLSQRNINPESMEGTSVIENYSYDGTALKQFSLDFIGLRFLHIPQKQQFILTSPMDEAFHITK